MNEGGMSEYDSDAIDKEKMRETRIGLALGVSVLSLQRVDR